MEGWKANWNLVVSFLPVTQELLWTGRLKGNQICLCSLKYIEIHTSTQNMSLKEKLFSS